MLTEDEKFMKQAIKLAKKASDAGEVPIGCVIVKDGDFFRVFPDFVDDADVSVKHVLVVVVADLHHAVACAPVAACYLDAFLAGVQEVLQEVV